MFLTYLRRELLNRRRQTIIVSIGLAVGIALVSTVSAISTGVKDSQSEVLNSLYGIGTDITITQQAAPGEDRPRFEIGANDGQQTNGVQTISSTRLRTERGATTIDDETVTAISKTVGVQAVATALKLTNTTFEGELPTFMQRQGGNDQGDVANGNGSSDQNFAPGDSTAPQTPTSTTPKTTSTTAAPSGGADGQGGSAFSVVEFSVLGVASSTEDVGPMSSVTLVSGRLLTSSDVGEYSTVVDSAYATTEELALKDTVSIGGKDFTIVGIVGPSAGAAATASNTYIPIDVARTLANVETGVTNVYVKATSGDVVATTSDSLSTLLPDATISTSADLAESVSGSLSTASDLMSNMGKWLSIIVLIVAFVIASLFTMAGVSRRTREFGTLKALGWKGNKIVRQVMAESVVQGMIGGLVGTGLAFAGVAIVNAVAPTLEATTGSSGFGGRNVGNQGGQSPFGGLRGQSAFDVVLHSSVTPKILGMAIGLAVLGGLLAGATGGMRAARLRPAESLRSVS